MSSVCRICLVGNTTDSVLNNILLSLYENLTNTKFHSEDARPRALCCYCYQKLLRCHTFTQMALRSEEILSHLIDNGLEVTHEYIAEVNPNIKQHLSVTTLQIITVDEQYAGSQATIKEEPLPHSDITEEVTTPPANLVEECTRSQLSLEDNRIQENYEELFTIPSEQTIPDDSEMMFICSMCNEIFDKKNKLISHLNNAHLLPTVKQYSSTGTTSMSEDQILHNVKKQFACNVCDKKYTSKSELTYHMRTHTGEKPFACSTCYQQFHRKSTLLIHLRSHSEKKTFICNECDKKFNQRRCLVAHLRTHLAETPFACNDCDKKFKRKKCLVQHIKIHMKEKASACKKTFICSICNQIFDTRSKLYSHKIKIHLPPTAKQYSSSRTKSMNEGKIQILYNVSEQFPCNKCDKIYNNKHVLAIHMKTHGEKLFSCKTCDKQFHYKQGLDKHMEMHTRGGPFTCKVCDRQFIRKPNLVKHKCDKQYKRKPNLVKHIKTVREKPLATHILNTHPQIPVKITGTASINKNQLLQKKIKKTLVKKQYVCHVCDKKFDHKSAFVRHMRSHTGEKPYTCNTCNNRFDRKSILIKHLRTHLVDKPFACNVCGKTYIEKCHFVTHMNTHSGERPFACNICDKQFYSKPVLVHHIKSHSLERAFACNVCHKKFKFKCHLMRHMTIHL